MLDTGPYPRFGGDRKYSAVDEGRLDQGTRQCDCCERVVTHVVDVQIDRFRGNDVVYYVCPFHVGQARRFHTFNKFLIDYKGETDGHSTPSANDG